MSKIRACFISYCPKYPPVVDIWQYGENILPIEIKSGKTGTLKSLRLFLSEKKAAMGVRFSLYPLSYNDSVLSIPLYAIEALPGLLKQVL